MKHSIGFYRIYRKVLSKPGGPMKNLNCSFLITLKGSHGETEFKATIYSWIELHWKTVHSISGHVVDEQSIEWIFCELFGRQIFFIGNWINDFHEIFFWIRRV